MQVVFSEDSYELFEVFPPSCGELLNPSYQVSLPYIPRHSAVQASSYKPLYVSLSSFGSCL